MKLIVSSTGEPEQLYNLVEDPEELNDLSDVHVDKTDDLRDLLELALIDAAANAP